MEDSEILDLYKKQGETPLERIQRFKENHPEYKDISMTYAGRLDPMAEGLLLILAGNTKDKDSYLTLDKSYHFDVLWGVETDTYDILGKVLSVDDTDIENFAKRLPEVLDTIRDKKIQSYPPFSSKTVDGKPLFEWARENRIEEIDIPKRNINITHLRHSHTRLVDTEEILNEILERVDLVKGDFRQDLIKDEWISALGGRDGEFMLLSSFDADVSSGTYIRSLAHEMGILMGTSAIAYRIKRTRIGEYNIGPFA